MSFLSDAEFLKRVPWDRAAPREIQQASGAGNVPALAAALQSQAPFDRVEPSTLTDLLGFDEASLSPRAAALQRGLQAVAAPRGRSNVAVRAALALETEALSQWSEQVAAGERPAPEELLILCRRLPEIGSGLPSDLFWKVWRVVLTGVLERLAAPPTPAAYDRPLIELAELPWFAASLFPLLQPAQEWKSTAETAFLEALDEQTDRLGTPHARLLPNLTAWLAPFVRVAETAAAEGTEAWSDDVAFRFRNLIERAAPLCYESGRTALDAMIESTSAAETQARLLQRAFVLSGWPDADAAGAALFEPLRTKVGKNGKKTRRPGKGGTHGHPETDIYLAPSMQSDAAELVCLRTSWRSNADLITVTHDGPCPRLELAAGGHPVFSGEWNATVTVGGRARPLRGEWECICWESDEDADYAEFQIYLARGLRVERQVFLSRTEHFALLADCITGLPDGRIEYQMDLPLWSGVTANFAGPTREGRFTAGDAVVRLFPLVLPQDRLHGTPGDCRVEDGRLVMKHVTQGTGLYIPFILDWDEMRSSAPAQWRQLTVSEDRKAVAADRGAGFRCKIGPHQLLVYRALTRSAEGRAVLGHHTQYETVIGTVDDQGDIESLLSVE